MAQPLFRLIALFAQIVLVEGSTNGNWEMPDVIHSNAIGSAFCNKFRDGFRLRYVGQENERDLPIPQMQDFQRLRSLPVRGRVFS
jgi:hypothetical protein